MSESIKQLMERVLTDSLAPIALKIVDESHLHAGHAGARPGGETHFRIDVAAAVFEGKSRIERHRIVNAALKGAFERGLHALALKARTPAELG